MNRYIILLLIGLSIQSLAVYGQLTIETCQEKARNNYPQIKQYDLIEQSELYSLSNANKGYLPQIALSATATYQSDITELPPSMGQVISQITGQDVEFSSISQDQYQLRAEVNQTLWDGGVIRSQKDNIKASSEIEKQKLEVNLYTLKDRINQLFFGILALNEQMVQIEILQKELQTNYEKVKAYMQSGIANQSDVDAIRVEQLKTKQRRTELVATQKSFKQMLSAMIGDSTPITDSLVKPDHELINNHDLSINRPELNLFEAQNNFFTSQESLIKSANRPKAGLFAQGGYGNPGLNMFEEGFTTYYMVGARISWGFSGLYKQKNNINKIEISKQNVNVQKETFLFNTQLKVSQSNNEIEKIKEQIKSDEEIIRLRTNIKKTAEVKLENGTLSVTDLIREINAENAAIQQKSLHEIQLLMAVYSLKNTINN